MLDTYELEAETLRTVLDEAQRILAYPVVTPSSAPADIALAARHIVEIINGVLAEQS